jgi:hypothetical protein
MRSQAVSGESIPPTPTSGRAGPSPCPKAANHLKRASAQGRTTQSPRFLRQGAAGLRQASLGQSEPIEAGIHCDHSGQTFLIGKTRNRIDGLIIEIWSNLHQQGRAGRQPTEPLHQAPQLD